MERRKGGEEGFCVCVCLCNCLEKELKAHIKQFPLTSGSCWKEKPKHVGLEDRERKKININVY